MPQHSPIDEICASDDFTFNVPTTAEPCAVQVPNEYTGLTVSPGDTYTLGFAYQGGTKSEQAQTFNIYLYNRNDNTDADGGSRAPGTPASPSTGLPDVTNISPSAPRPSKPKLNPSQRAAFDIDGTLPTDMANPNADVNDLFWFGTATVVAPGDDANTDATSRVHADVTTFTGRVELII